MVCGCYVALVCDSVQTISGTGANHLGALFLSRFYEWNGPPIIGLSNPTWCAYFLLISERRPYLTPSILFSTSITAYI